MHDKQKRVALPKDHLSPSLYSLHFICGATLAHSFSLSLSNCGGGCLIVSRCQRRISLSPFKDVKRFFSKLHPFIRSYTTTLLLLQHYPRLFFLPVVFRQLFRTVVNVIVIVRLLIDFSFFAFPIQITDLRIVIACECSSGIRGFKNIIVVAILTQEEEEEERHLLHIALSLRSKISMNNHIVLLKSCYQ